MRVAVFCHGRAGRVRPPRRCLPANLHRIGLGAAPGVHQPSYRHPRQGWRLLICEEIAQASSGRCMSLKLGTLVVSKLSMTFRQTTHFAASPSLLGTSDGVAE